METRPEITEPKQDETALRQNQDRFRALVTASSDAMYRMSADWSEMRQLRGGKFVADSVAPSRTWLHDYVHPDDRPRMLAVIQEAIRNKNVFEMEHRVLRADGSLGWTFSRAVPLLDANGEIMEWFGAASDITERKRAEETLRESEERYRTLVETIDEGFCVIEVLFDPDGRPNNWRYLEVNPAFEKHNGLTQATGKTIRDLVPNIEARWFDNYGRVATTGEPMRFEEFSPALSRWFDVYAVRVGRPEQRRVAVLFNNITQRKQAEEISARLSAIIHFSGDAIISKNLDGIVTSWNPSAERIFGYAAGEIIGQLITLIIPPELQDEEMDFLARMRRGEHIDHYETVRMHKSGRRVDVSLSISPVFNMSGTLFGISKIARDITDRKQSELALIRSEKLASVGRLAATIAHEINNPLASAINAVYLAKTDPALPESVKSNLALAEQELARVSHISKQTLGFYKEVGTPTIVDVPGVLDSLLDLYRSRLRNKNISVQRRYRSNTAICAIEGELRQIVSNIIANSIDALPEGGNLHVRLSGPQVLRGERRMVRLTIADDGEGIAAENLKSIFDPFFTTKQLIGTGLGLWVTSELVKKRGGRLRLKSRLGKGTVMAIWLPMERRAQERCAA